MAEKDSGKLDVYKVSLCGKSGVGKTSIFRRVRGDDFKENTSEFKHLAEDKIKVRVNGKTIKIHLWDTSGMERYSRLTRQHYFGSHVVLFIYDCDEEDSVKELATCYSDAQTNAKGAAMVLVRNKTDQELQSVGIKDAEKRLCNHEEKGLPVCKFKFSAETSAKTNTGIKELIERVAEYLVKNAEPSNSQNAFDKVKVTHEDPLPTPPASNSCC